MMIPVHLFQIMDICGNLFFLSIQISVATKLQKSRDYVLTSLHIGDTKYSIYLKQNRNCHKYHHSQFTEMIE